MNFRPVGIFSNDTDQELIIYLELKCEEIHMLPGHEIVLLAEDNDEHFPMNISYRIGSIQIYPHDGSPEWRFIFNGKEYKADYPSKLSELE